MATQYQQVLAAVRDIGSKGGTPKEIYAKILETNPKWKAQIPTASVSMYLSKNKDTFKNDNGIWKLRESNPQDSTQASNSTQSVNKKPDKRIKERGLYLITLSPYIKIRGAGFLFKIGQSDDVKKRLVGYSAALPVETIQVISFYPIPDEVKLEDAEKEVNGELLGNENLGADIFNHKIAIRPFFQNHQREWLQTLDIIPSMNNLLKLAIIIDGIVKATIETLTPKLKEETADE